MPPFGPLTMLLLLCYVLFLGVVMALWFALTPAREAERPSERAASPAEPERKDVCWDDVRGANARRVSVGKREARAEQAVPLEEPQRSPALTPSKASSESSKAAKPSQKRREDAFEDFIRSKNDDFEF